MDRLPYKRRTSEEALREVMILDSKIANIEIAQRIAGPDDDFGFKRLDQYRSDRRAIINDFNME